MNIGLPIDVFSKILLVMADREGNLPLEDAMKSGKLDEYIQAYKAGELDLSNVKSESDGEDYDDE